MKSLLSTRLFMMMLMCLALSCALFAQATQTAVPTNADLEEPIEETFEEPVIDIDTAPQMGGLEIFARKLVGSYLVTLFIDGGVVMWPILFLFIWGLAISIWKLVALSYAKINVSNFLNGIIPLIKDKKYKEALEYAQKTRGPVAVMTASGLLKIDISTEAVEKAIENTATVEMAFLEKQFISMSTVITLGPLLGFFGTIQGMIEAFNAIAAAGDVDPTIVADGISIALITTLAGLAVAIPIQLFFNIELQLVDNLVLDMQRASDKVMETIVENK